MAIERRTRADGSTAFRVQFRNPVTGRKESDGRTTASLTEAREWDAAIKRRIKVDPESFRPADWRPEDHGPTFGELALAYLQRPDLAASTKHRAVYHLKVIVDHLGDLQAQDITADHLKRFERSQAAEGRKQNTIHNRFALIRGVLSWAAHERIIPANPVRDYRCKRGPDERIPPPSPAEVRAILAAADPHLARAIRLAYCLGVRVGASELFGLRWEDVDWQSPSIRVRAAQKNKAAPWRTIPLRADLLPPLRAWAAEDSVIGTPWIIHWRGQPVASLKKSWASALKRAGITRRVRPYDIRHAFATEALARGADPLATARVMGHTTTAMLHKHYQHVLDDQRRAVVDALPSIGDEAERGEHPGEQIGGIQGGFSFPVGEKLQ